MALRRRGGREQQQMLLLHQVPCPWSKQQLVVVAMAGAGVVVAVGQRAALGCAFSFHCLECGCCEAALIMSL